MDLKKPYSINEQFKKLEEHGGVVDDVERLPGCGWMKEYVHIQIRSIPFHQKIYIDCYGVGMR